MGLPTGGRRCWRHCGRSAPHCWILVTECRTAPFSRCTMRCIPSAGIAATFVHLHLPVLDERVIGAIVAGIDSRPSEMTHSSLWHFGDAQALADHMAVFGWSAVPELSIRECRRAGGGA